MYFASGLFIPISQLPTFMRGVAPYLPAYHYGQVAWEAIGAPPDNPLWQSAAWLAGYAVVFAIIAVRAYRVDETRKFG